MPVTFARLPEAQLLPLERAYRDAVSARHRTVLLGIVALVLALAASAVTADVNPAVLWANLGRFTNYLARLFYLDSGALVFTNPAEWFWGLPKWSRLLWETIVIAYTGTLFGALIGFFLSFVAAANLTRNAWIRLPVRRFLEFCRTVPEIVFALIFVVSFGLGPLPGILAITIHTVGAMGKLFSEVAENVDMKPVEGVYASGGSWGQAMRYAVVPQVLSNYASYALLRFEINVRGAAVMGFVGAGGIGQDLIESIRKFYYSDISALLVIIIATVMVIDMVTERIRHALIGMERR